MERFVIVTNIVNFLSDVLTSPFKAGRELNTVAEYSKRDEMAGHGVP